MERQTSGDALGPFDFDDMVRGEACTPMEIGSGGLRGLDQSAFRFAAASQDVESTFENTTYRSAPQAPFVEGTTYRSISAVDALDAEPTLLRANAAGLAKPSLVPLSLSPGAVKAPLQTVVVPNRSVAAAAPRNGVADATLAAEVVVGPVPGFPYELEPITVVKKDFNSHAEAATALMAGLRDASVDFAAEPKRAIWRCNLCTPAAFINFTVQIHMAAGRYLFEFQRRSGEGLAFMAAYRGVKASLLGTAPRKVGPTLDMLSLSLPESLLKLVPVPVEDAEAEVAGAVSMLKSAYLDVQQEGIRSLSELTAESAARARIGACPAAIRSCLDAVTHFLSSALEVESRSFAACTLANVTEHAAFRDALMATPEDAAVIHTLAGFVQNGSYEDAQMRREAARSLANLARSHGGHVTALLGAAALRDFIQGLNALEDPLVRSYALEASAGLQVQSIAA